MRSLWTLQFNLKLVDASPAGAEGKGWHLCNDTCAGTTSQKQPHYSVLSNPFSGAARLMPGRRRPGAHLSLHSTACPPLRSKFQKAEDKKAPYHVQRQLAERQHHAHLSLDRQGRTPRARPATDRGCRTQTRQKKLEDASPAGAKATTRGSCTEKRNGSLMARWQGIPYHRARFRRTLGGRTSCTPRSEPGGHSSPPHHSLCLACDHSCR